MATPDDRHRPFVYFFMENTTQNPENNTPQSPIVLDALVQQNRKEKDESIKFKDRRFNQWNENYYLYRDKIITNRLTQRQAVNVPIVRESIQTWISKIDEAPELMFETRGMDNASKDGEIVLNEIWGYYYDKLKLDILDNMEKKIVGLQGRGFKKWGWAKNEIFCDLIDPYDIEIDPRANPLYLDSARYVIHKNIFRPLRNILANKKYNQTEVSKLKTYLDSKAGLIASATAKEALEEKNQKLATLGAANYDEYKASDVIVEINESYKLIWHEKEQRFVRHLIVIAADCAVLVNKPLEQAIGISRLPIVTWASDPDLSDLWSDGIADNVRTFNKVTNIYISQDLENRTYRNFGMYFYDTMKGAFTPRSFEAKPFGMYGVPGKPEEIVKQMRIEPLNDTAQQITFMKELIQSSVAQTPTERGVNTNKNATLGEVELQLQQSQGRNEVVSKNYRRAWKESGEIFYELLNANSMGSLTLYKKSADGTYQPKEITPATWKNPKGYECKVVMKEEKQMNDDRELKKLSYIKNSFPNNPIAQKIVHKKELELLGWTTDEIQQVIEFEEQPQVPPEAMLSPDGGIPTDPALLPAAKPAMQ